MNLFVCTYKVSATLWAHVMRRPTSSTKHLKLRPVHGAIAIGRSLGITAIIQLSNGIFEDPINNINI